MILRGLCLSKPLWSLEFMIMSNLSLLGQQLWLFITFSLPISHLFLTGCSSLNSFTFSQFWTLAHLPSSVLITLLHLAISFSSFKIQSNNLAKRPSQTPRLGQVLFCASTAMDAYPHLSIYYILLGWSPVSACFLDSTF